VGIQNVGKGYEAGKSFEVANGVSLKLGSGSVNATDTFSAYMVGEPDETGLLSALGLNSLFQGSEPGSYSVRSDLRSNPERLATTTSGLPGESLNFARIASLRDVRVHELGGRTFVEEISDVSASAGLIVQTSGKQSTQLEAYQTRLHTDRDSISGVDMNQEMLEMMQGQRAFQASAKYLQSADQMLDELFSLVR
jgi:flagellar hook-associated protein FlgK